MTATQKLRALDEARIAHRAQKRWTAAAVAAVALVAAIVVHGLRMLTSGALTPEAAETWHGVVGVVGIFGGMGGGFWFFATVITCQHTARAVREANYAYHDALEELTQ